MSEFIEQFKQKLALPLPGLEAQMKMAPPIRSSSMQAPENARLGGVMILLFEADKIWHTILIRRSEDGKTHSGQISFPGGKKDPNDFSIIETASRECEEEIGVHRNQIEILGCLTPLYIPPSNFFVYAFLSYTENWPDFNHQQTEVQEILEVPLSVIRDLPKPPLTMELPRTNGYKVPYFDFQNHKIWGATSMILSELNELLKNV